MTDADRRPPPLCEHRFVLHLLRMPEGYDKPGVTKCELCGALPEAAAVAPGIAPREPLLSDAHRWELERLVNRLKAEEDQWQNFPLIQALEAALKVGEAEHEIRTLHEQLDAQRSWRCFHCGEVFTTLGGAQDHFGATPENTTGCLIDRVALEEGGKPERGRGLQMALRKAEQREAETRAALIALRPRLIARIAERVKFQAEHIAEVIGFKGEHSASCMVCAQLDVDRQLLEDAAALTQAAGLPDAQERP